MAGGARYLVAVLLVTAVEVRGAPKVVESQQAPDRSYRIFVGLDVKLFDDGDYHPIAGIRNRRVLLGGMGEFQVDLRRTERAHFERVPKVAGLPLSIADLNSVRDYSIIDQTSENWMGQQASVQSNEAQTRLTGDLKTRSNPSNVGQRQRGENTFYNPSMSMDDRIELAQNADIQTQLDQEFYADDGRQQSEEKTALVIEAKVSAPAPITNAYAIGFVRARVDGLQSDFIVFGEIGELGPEPRRVRIRKEELPLKMEILETSLHVYRQGHELVSNLSDKQFPVSRDEIHEYVSLAHMADHREETRPPEPEWSLAPPGLLSAVDGSQFDYPVKVAVDEKGRVVSIDDNAVVADPVRAALQSLVFKPALADGNPVAGETTVNLRDYFR